jgi:Tfp pilus assembly protein PilN
MIRINLLPQDERPTSHGIRLPKAQMLVPVALFLLVALPIAVTTMSQARTESSLKTSITEVEKERARLKPEIERMHRLNQQTQELNHRIEVVADLDEASTYYVEMLDDLSQILPQHMWLTKVEEDTARSVAMIEGYTFTNLLVADLMVRLDKVGHFSNVVLIEINRSNVEGRDVLKFQLEVQMTPNADKEESGEPS